VQIRSIGGPQGRGLRLTRLGATCKSRSVGRSTRQAAKLGFAGWVFLAHLHSRHRWVATNSEKLRFGKPLAQKAHVSRSSVFPHFPSSRRTKPDETPVGRKPLFAFSVSFLFQRCGPCLGANVPPSLLTGTSVPISLERFVTGAVGHRPQTKPTGAMLQTGSSNNAGLFAFFPSNTPWAPNTNHRWRIARIQKPARQDQQHAGGPALRSRSTSPWRIGKWPTGRGWKGPKRRFTQVNHVQRHARQTCRKKTNHDRPRFRSRRNPLKPDCLLRARASRQREAGTLSTSNAYARSGQATSPIDGMKL